MGVNSSIEGSNPSFSVARTGVAERGAISDRNLELTPESWVLRRDRNEARIGISDLGRKSVQLNRAATPQVVARSPLVADGEIVSLEEPPFLAEEERIRRCVVVVEGDKRLDRVGENAQRDPDIPLELPIGDRCDKHCEFDHRARAPIEPWGREIVRAEPIELSAVDRHTDRTGDIPVRVAEPLVRADEARRPGCRAGEFRAPRVPRGAWCILSRPGRASPPESTTQAKDERDGRRNGHESSKEYARRCVPTRPRSYEHAEYRRREGHPDHPNPPFRHADTIVLLSAFSWRASGRAETIPMIVQ